MKQYHGTKLSSARDICNGKLNVLLGGGELGRGFYTGDLLYEAFNWAYHKYKKDKTVVELEVEDNDFLQLEPLCLEPQETGKYRQQIKNKKETKSYLFKRNIVWAPIVGKNVNNFNQMKYESDDSQSYLNSSKVIKKII